MSRSAETEVAVIGGGIAGCATALFLRRRDIPVTVLERDRCGIRASGVNFGGVRHQGRDLREIPLSLRGREVWQNLPALIGIDGELMQTGHLRLARSAEDMQILERYRDEARPLGLELELLGRDALGRRFPWIGAMPVGGSFSPLDGHANPRLVAPAFAVAARAAGAEVREGTEVVAVERDGDVFRLALRGGPELRCRILVNAAGAWGNRIAAFFDEDVSMRAEVPQVMVTEPAPYRVGPVLGVIGGDLYLRQIPRGNVIFGGGEGVAGGADYLLSRPRPEIAARAASMAARIAPFVEKLSVIRMWTGVDGTTADGCPVVGPSGRVPGLLHAFAFCGHGFQLGPAAGLVLAELIADGRTATSIEGLSIARFQPRLGAA
mgnify:CR=1 FL=1